MAEFERGYSGEWHESRSRFLADAMESMSAEVLAAIERNIKRVVEPLVDAGTVARHPDLAELNVRMDALYDPPNDESAPPSEDDGARATL